MGEKKSQGNPPRRFDTLGDLLRSVEPPPEPSVDHIAHLNRLVRQRIDRRHGLGRLWEWLGGGLASVWYHPLGERGLALAGLAGVLGLGLWIGTSIDRGVTNAPQPVIATGGALERALPPDTVLSLQTPDDQPDLEIYLSDLAAIPGTVPEPARSSPDINPFPSVYVVASDEPTVSGNWATLAGLQPSELTEGRFAAENRLEELIEALGLDEPVAEPAHTHGALPSALSLSEPPAETAQSRVARTIVEEDLLGDLRRFKLDLYLSGETDMIPRVQRIEEVLYQVLASQTGSFSADPADVEAQRRFSEAEGYLLRRDFRRAEELFNDIAHEHSGTRLANLSWYHLGDIYHDFHSDFAGARQCYERCLEGQPEEVFPPETLERIEHRLTLLQDGATDGYAAIRLLRQAEAAPAEAAIDLYRRLLTEHPASLAAVDGINSLAERGLAQLPAAPDLPYEAITLLRECQALPDFPHTALAQLRLADIVFFRLGDYSQALIEYGEVEVSPDDTALESMVRDRIAQILDSRISQRDF